MDLYRRFYRDMDDYEALSAYLVVIKIDPQDGSVEGKVTSIYRPFYSNVYYYEKAFRLEPLQKIASVFGYVLL